LRCIELFSAKADGRFNVLELPCIFEALQLLCLSDSLRL
jgi:hypothetical protein